MKITFPHMGNTYIAAKTLLDELKINYIIPPFNNKKALEIGTRYAPEQACLPLKINIGNYIQAYENGADTVLIAGGSGPCRFGYYCELEREILNDAGYNMDFLVLELPSGKVFEFIRRIKKTTNTLNPYKITKALRCATYTSIFVDRLEKTVFKMSAREIEKGRVRSIYKKFLNRALTTKGYKNMKELIKNTEKEIMKVEIDKELNPIKVGIVGEIYTTIDCFPNFEINSRLASMGVEVDREVTISQWIIEHMLKKLFHIKRDTRFKEAAKPYIKEMIGGHAQETIGNTVLYAKNNFDGVIQIYPLSCMPEIVANSIIHVVEKDYDIPVLTLIVDEMTGEAGLVTRIEAFVDLLHKRRERKNYNERAVIPRN